MWIPEKSAFRAGTVTGTEWDAANIGADSVAFGLDNLTSGPVSIAFGYSNQVSANAGVALGGENTIGDFAGFGVAIGNLNHIGNAADNSVALGYENVVNGSNAVALGSSHTINSISGVALGHGGNVNGNYQTVFGKFNASLGDTVALIVGNGTSSDVRSNALELTFTGDLEIAGNYVLSSARPTKIGTGPDQLLGFYNTTPVDQPAAVADATDADSVILRLNELLARVRELGLIAT